MLLAAIVLALTPWTGPSLPTVSPNSAKYRLTVRGTPQGDVRLQATGLPSGWIASFCTTKLCSPYRYTLHLDAKGRGELEFQAIRLDDSAPKRVHLTVLANNGTSAEATAYVR